MINVFHVNNNIAIVIIKQDNILLQVLSTGPPLDNYTEPAWVCLMTQC